MEKSRQGMDIWEKEGKVFNFTPVCVCSDAYWITSMM